MWWKAWYDIEPRGDARSDWHAALMAFPHAKDGMTLLDVQRLLKDLWNPPDRDEKERRKEERKRRARKKMNDYSRACADMLQERKKGAKNVKQQRRAVVDSDGD